MPDRILKVAVTTLAVLTLGVVASGRGLPQAGADYQVVKVCSLLSIAEVMSLSPSP